MTPLLSFVNVSKRYDNGSREICVLDRVSLDIDAGASVGVFGTRRSGKSTLLRLAAGITLPDSGAIHFQGQDITRIAGRQRGRLLRGEIAYMSTADWRINPGESVVDHVATSLGSMGLTIREARRRAMQALEQVEVGAGGAEEAMTSLPPAARARVMLARALAREPQLLVLDEPALLPNLGDRDRFYALLRSAAGEHSMTLLMASEEMAALQGTRVLMSIANGEVVSTEARGKVVALPTRAGAGRYGP
jgi:ABC-type multidrug transport system ATPase subunit